jgi:hypothetical protein
MKTLYILIISLWLAIELKAQDNQSLNHGFAIGFQLAQHQRDFGFGINATSPHFWQCLAVRARGNLMWFEYVDEDAETTWTPYTDLSLGIVSIGREVGDFMRLYGEGGFTFILPNSEFSSSSLDFGGYGLFGFEFNFDSASKFFVELGGRSGGTADRIPTNPLFSNGFMIQTGFRVQF